MTRTVEDPRADAIRRAVAERSAELGPPVRPRDVDVEIVPNEVAPGCQLFRATWGGARDARSLAGLLRDDDPPDTYPGQALAKVLRRSAEGDLLHARNAASAAAYLLDSDLRHRVILTADDAAGESGVGPPQLIDEPGRLGVSFWWTTGDVLSLLIATIDDDDRLTVDERVPPATDSRTP